MAVTTDIVESWRRPRVVIRRHLSRGVSEPFAFSLLVVFLLMAFVAQWPVASRAAVLQPEVPVAQRLVAGGLAILATIPLWYGLAALSRVVARALGGVGNWYGARMALFWSLVAVSPVMLLQGMVQGMIGPGPALTSVRVLVIGGFLYLWLNALIEEARG
jgi:hypothetical protein